MVGRFHLALRLTAVVVAVCLVVAPTANAFSLFSRFSAEDERKLSEKFLLMVRQRFEVVDDPAVNIYIASIGARLGEGLDYKTFPYHFYVINSDTLNAFAAPGGHIFIFSGLITRLNSEGELAGIMAHEMSHVSCRHLAKQMERGTKIGLATLAMALAGAFLGGGGALSEAATMGALAAGQSLSLKYSRTDEEEADRMGLKLLRKAGYDGADMAQALRTIYRYRWYGSDEIPNYLSSHPGTEDRISYIEDMNLASPVEAPRRQVEPLVFKKLQTKLLATTGDARLALTRFEGTVKDHPDDFMARYGLGLALRRLEKGTEAQAAFQEAVKLRPNDPDILRDLGVSYFESGKIPAALVSLHQCLAARPDDAAAIYYLGRASQEAGDLNTALDSYQRLAGAGMESPELYQQLGLVYAKKGNLAAGHYYSGMAFKLRGDMRNAVFHLKAALPLYKGKPEEDKVRTALKDAEEELGEGHHKGSPKEPGQERHSDKAPGQEQPKAPQSFFGGRAGAGIPGGGQWQGEGLWVRGGRP
jgi:predicted Zn-dependent protease